MGIDPYEVLQVHQKAELDVIRAAFRTLARKYHPDAGGTGARMSSLNEAWAILGHAESRAALDLALAAALEVSQPAAPATSSAHANVKYGPSGSDRAGAVSNEPGRVLDFGRYVGWSLRELARHDPIYLEWLERTTIGRPLRAEIQELLRAQASAGSPGAAAPPKVARSRFSLRAQ